MAVLIERIKQLKASQLVHGGKRAGAGRPRKSTTRRNPKTFNWGDDELELINDVRGEMSFAEYVRTATMQAAKIDHSVT